MSYIELLDQLRAEHDAIVNENKNFRAFRDDFTRKFEHQLNELTSMERALLDLERKHQLIKDQYDAEIARLKSAAASSNPPIAHSSSLPTSVPPSLPQTSSADPHPHLPSQPPTHNIPQSQQIPISSPQSQHQPPQHLPQPPSVSQPHPSINPVNPSPVISIPPAIVQHPADHSQSQQPMHQQPLPSQHHQSSQIRQSQPQPLLKALPSSQPSVSSLQQHPQTKLDVQSSINRSNLNKPHSMSAQRSHLISEPSPINPYNSTLGQPHSSRPVDHLSSQQPNQQPQPQHSPYSHQQRLSLQQPLHRPPHLSSQHPLPQQPNHHSESLSEQHPMKFPRLQAPESHLSVQPNSTVPLPSPGSLASPPNTMNPVLPSPHLNGPHSSFNPPSKMHALVLGPNGPGQDDLMHQPRPFKRESPLTSAPSVTRGSHVSVMPPALNHQSAHASPPHRYRSLGNPSQLQTHQPPLSHQPHPAHPHHQNVIEDDWSVTYGRTSGGGTVNVKVSLQNTLAHNSVVCCVRYSWDGCYLATGSNRTAQIFDRSGQNVATFSKDSANDRDDVNGADSYVRAVCFSPDGHWLITGAEDHVVKVWDVRSRTVRYKLTGHDTDIYSVDASHNGRFIISGSGDKKAKLWNLETGKLMSTLGEDYGPTDGITSVSVSPTSQYVAAGSLDKIVRVWDVETSSLVRQFEGHRDSVYSVVFSPEGTSLLSGSLDKTLMLWDLTTGQPSAQCRMTFMGHKDFVLSVAYSPDGRWLISGSKDRTVQFWDPRSSTASVTLQGHKNSVISIAHNPTRPCLATGSGDCRARTWVYH